MEQLIDNTFDGKASKRDAEREVKLEARITIGRNEHLNDTKTRRALFSNISNAVVQGRDVGCSILLTNKLRFKLTRLNLSLFVRHAMIAAVKNFIFAIVH